MTIFLRAGAIALIAMATAGAQGDTVKGGLRKRTAYEDLQMFSQVLNQIRVNHPDSIDTHDLFLAAVEGMVHAADPHSFVIPAMRLDTAKQRAYDEGKLVPLPVEFRFVGGTPVVASVNPASQAARQNVLRGDVLVSVDGKPVRAESPLELDVLLAGPKKSRVKLGLERLRVDGSTARLEREVMREQVDEATAVPTAFLLDDSTGYVRITSFLPQRVADDLHAAIGRLEAGGMRRLVLDLRDNGGGLIDQAAKVAGEFLPKGALVYTSEGRKKEMIDTARVSRSFWRSERRDALILMVNAGTASASELLAGALQDHDRALIVGQTTFGKALIMRGFPMTDGSMIVLVVGQLRTPCGRLVQRQYHDVTRTDYYRLSAEERDTAGRPSCRTDAGRTVYGGGGIFPDLKLGDDALTPAWLSRIHEIDLSTSWAAAWVTANSTSLPSIGDFAKSPSLPASALSGFRSLAATKGIAIPTDADSTLQRALLRAVAQAKYGDAGYYQIVALTDPDVKRAVAAFERAAVVLAGKK